MIQLHRAGCWQWGAKWIGFRVGKEVDHSNGNWPVLMESGEGRIQDDSQFYLGNQTGRRKGTRERSHRGNQNYTRCMCVCVEENVSV